ncbi:MAG: ABC transporter ATP-binding protein [Spirochaetia bacterium]
MEKLLETKDLRTKFFTFEGVVQALNGVSVTVNQGETYGLVGESGCGKSVTVRSIMRIVQAPGKITDGKILLFFSKKERAKGIDILKRSEAYMRTIRGNDISMIFQEASTALNPVFSIGAQVGESYRFHRMVEVIEATIEELDRKFQGKVNPLSRCWYKFQKSMFQRELKVLKRYRERIIEIDDELYRLGEDEENRHAKHNLQQKRKRIPKTEPLVSFIRRVPFIRRYRRRLNKTIRGMVIDLLTKLGVPNPQNIVDRYPHELSGGMQQRIVIAIALACNPVLLIADEPTSNLDVTIQAQIVKLIKELKDTVITSVVFITHDLGLVAEVCDRVTVMYAGDTCETAPVKELFKNPLHPYTQGLLESVPKMDQKGALQTIKGTVPNLIHPPTGCRFHPRCPHAMEICSREKPPVTEFSPDHTVSCHLYPREEYNNG